MDSTDATPVISNTELVITTSDIAIDTSIDSPTGTFRESSPAEISITTDNYTGYSLSINAKDDTESSSKLINSDETAEINSITSISTQDDFTSNTWGIKPNKVEGNDNTNYLPAPTIEGTNIDTTSQANAEPNTYTMSIATKVDYDLPADKYSSNMLIIVVGNPAIYTIEYDKNVDGDVSNMPATQASDTQDTSVTLASNKPTSTKKYKFLSWCDGTVIDHDGIPECTGTVYNPGDEYDLDQTTDNHVVLYGMWDRTATLLKGSDFERKIVALANNNYGNIAAVKSADALPDGFSPATKNIISISSSPDVYAWWDNTDNAKTIYIYTDASRIKTNSDCSTMFYSLTSLTNISGVTDWDTINTTNMSSMFYQTKITNTDALSTGTREGNDYVSWDTSSVTDMTAMFSGTLLTDISGLSNWDTSGVTDMGNMFNGTSSLTDISGLSNWNTSNVTNMSNMFSGFKITNTDALSTGTREGNNYVSWDTSNVTNMSNMFRNASSLTDISGLSNWDTSSVTNMSSMFYQTKITNTDALSTGTREGNDYVSWDTSSVTDMSSMFNYVSSITNISGLSNWNTSSVTNMSYMFNGTKITNVNSVINWNTANVISMESMFSYTSLTDISGLSNWNTSNVTNMCNMFSSTKITNTDALSTGTREGNDYVSWDTSSVTDMTAMFSGTLLTDISGLSNWDTSKVTSMGSMFSRTRITNIDALATGIREYNDYVSWDTSSVTQMSNMFYGTYYLTDVNGAINWDTSNVTNMGSIFMGAISLTNISGLTNWDTSKVTSISQAFRETKITNIDALATGIREGNNYVSWDMSKVQDMYQMFYGASSLTNINGAINWDTSNVTNMNQTFSLASSLRDISGATNWNTSKLTNMNQTFVNTKLTNIDALATGTREGKNYVSWDVSKVTNMAQLFSGVTTLENISGVSGWDISNVTTIDSMFSRCPLTDISSVTNWDTSKVTKLGSMFMGAKVTNLDALSTGTREGKDYVSWDVSKVTDMGGLFREMPNLVDISGISNWNTSKVTSMGSMFYGDSLLSDISSLESWDVTKVTYMNSMFYNCTSLTAADALSPLNNWTINASLSKTDMFYNIPASVIRPTWY